MSILETILATRRQAIAEAKVRLPQARLEQEAAARRDFRGLAAALEQPGLRIVAEIKRASPSRGPIRLHLDPAALARAYAEGGAAALSVLTEPAFFQGSPGDLHHARAAVPLPVLRKDFIFDPYQVYESAAMGADAILLIVRMLDDGPLQALHALARQLGLDVLTEVHDERDIARANALGATLVGINNRDLSHFGTDIGRATRLAGLLNPGTVAMALSGIHTAEDVRQTVAGGIRRILVGEALVRQADPAATLRAWIDAAAGTDRATTAGTAGLTGAAGVDGGRGALANLKICGITARETARLCADLGVGALGAVFFPGSPRCVTPGQARLLFEGLPETVARVGVFVDRPSGEVLDMARAAALDTVQLHGGETAADCLALHRAGFRVIKVLKTTGIPLVAAARGYPPEIGILVECGTGSLPGGNGAAWNWREAAPLATQRPFALAGGLTPHNLPAAMRLSGAVAWDMSSGVERAPGVKDHAAIEVLARLLRAGTDVPAACPPPANRFWAPVHGRQHP